MTWTDLVSVTTYVVVGEELAPVMAARDRALQGHRVGIDARHRSGPRPPGVARGDRHRGRHGIGVVPSRHGRTDTSIATLGPND